MADLSFEDLQQLSTLASEKGEDRSLPMKERERWLDIAERVIDGKATSRDLIAVAELAAVDSLLQRDSQVAKRYMALSQRARAAST